MSDKRVVVTGIGAVSPIGNNITEYWESLKKGVNGIDRITKFDTEGQDCKLAGEVKNLDVAGILGKSAARKTDPFTQYALIASIEAYENSKIGGTVDEYDIGVYFGSGIGGIQTLCQENQNEFTKGPTYVSPQFIPKMINNIAAGNIAIKLGAKGSCMSVCTACATGTTAIGEAYRAIKHGYAKAMVCGGSEASITPLAVAGFVNCMALSKASDRNAASLPFDSRRAGFVVGEGAAALILEEYEHAVNRGAEIYAEVAGYGSACDAYHVTAPEPSASSVIRAVSQAAESIMNTPAEFIYINAHGTGTKLNDVTETVAFKGVFGDEAYKLHISSTKSMTGHMLGAAGAAEAIAAILAMKEDIVPPTINLTNPDPECDLNYTPQTAETTKIKVAMSTSLGFGGHDTCVAFKKIDR